MAPVVSVLRSAHPDRREQATVTLTPLPLLTVSEDVFL